MAYTTDGIKCHISDSDISGEPQETQDICNAVWTDEVKAAWTAFQAEQEALRNPEPE